MGESPLVKRVLAVVAAIPPGNVTSYGEVAKVAGCGARNVGTVLKRHGAGAAWWRVVRAGGASHDPARAAEFWDREAIAPPTAALKCTSTESTPANYRS